LKEQGRGLPYGSKNRRWQSGGEHPTMAGVPVHLFG